jgi:lysophospholipase L1-like esterase
VNRRPARVGPTMRAWLGAMLPGARERRIQAAAYAGEWLDDNRAALASDGPLWIALGDSTAQGIGASARSHGYVLEVLRSLRTERDPAWRVVNLSATGDRVADVLARQIPAMTKLPAPALVTCAVGANDVLRTPQATLEDGLRRLAARLPGGSLLANLPQGLSRRRSETTNGLVRELVEGHGLVLVDLWRHTGPPWTGKFAADHFHPNDTGYRDWVVAFREALEP